LIGLVAVAALVGCGSKSASEPAPSTEATPSTTSATSTTSETQSFCTDLGTALNGITALGAGAAASTKTAASSLFTQLATYLDRLAPGAPDNLGPALTTMANSFRKAGDVLAQPGGTSENVLADPEYLAATKQFVNYLTTKCEPSSGS
jgi:hypothetical protein